MPDVGGEGCRFPAPQAKRGSERERGRGRERSLNQNKRCPLRRFVNLESDVWRTCLPGFAHLQLGGGRGGSGPTYSMHTYRRAAAASRDECTMLLCVSEADYRRRSAVE